MTHAGPAPTDLQSALEEMRVSVAGAGMPKGLAGILQEAFLKILGLLVALLMDFRSGRLAGGPLAAVAPDAGAPCAADAGDTACAASGTPGEPGGPTLDSSCRGWWPGSWFRRHGWISVDRVPAFVGMPAGLGEEGANGTDGAAAHPQPDPSPSRGDGLLLRDGSRHARRGERFVSGPMRRRKNAAKENADELRASLRPQWCIMIARRMTELSCGQLRDARGIRRALPPYDASIQKIRGLVEGVRAISLFRCKNDLVKRAM